MSYDILNLDVPSLGNLALLRLNAPAAAVPVTETIVIVCEGVVALEGVISLINILCVPVKFPVIVIVSVAPVDKFTSTFIVPLPSKSFDKVNASPVALS